MTQGEIHHDPASYAPRNHLLDFLISRSVAFRDEKPGGHDPGDPPLVRLGARTRRPQVRNEPMPRRRACASFDQLSRTEDAREA